MFFFIEKLKYNKLICFKILGLQCNGGWHDVEGQCLKIFHVKKNWAEAQNACEAEGGNLATIRNKATNDWIVKNRKGHNIWFGATDQFTEGSWVDPTNTEPIVFKYWGENELNGGTEENCALFSTEHWADVKCRFGHYYVCGRPSK